MLCRLMSMTETYGSIVLPEDEPESPDQLLYTVWETRQDVWMVCNYVASSERIDGFDRNEYSFWNAEEATEKLTELAKQRPAPGATQQWLEYVSRRDGVETRA